MSTDGQKQRRTRRERSGLSPRARKLTTAEDWREGHEATLQAQEKVNTWHAHTCSTASSADVRVVSCSNRLGRGQGARSRRRRRCRARKARASLSERKQQHVCKSGRRKVERGIISERTQTCGEWHGATSGQRSQWHGQAATCPVCREQRCYRGTSLISPNQSVFPAL